MTEMRHLLGILKDEEEPGAPAEPGTYPVRRRRLVGRGVGEAGLPAALTGTASVVLGLCGIDLADRIVEEGHENAAESTWPPMGAGVGIAYDAGTHSDR